MNSSTEESGLGDCLICFIKIENYVLLPGQESQKIVDNCWNYLYENIVNSKLQNVQSGNVNDLPLCKKCFDAASELMELSELVIKSHKKILNLSFEFSLGVLARRTQVETVNNLPNGQISAKELIVLDVSRISPSLFSTDQPNPTEVEDFTHPCEDNLSGRMGVAVVDSQHIFEIVKYESEDAVDDESAKPEDDTDISKGEEFQAYTRPVAVVKSKKLKEAKVSEKFNSNSSPQQSPSNPSSLKHRLRNGTSKKKQSISSNMIHGKTGSKNVNKEKKSVSSRKVRGKVGTGKKQHKCQECEKVFASTSDLKKHIRVHTGEKPFKCSFCGKAFNQTGSLKTHKRIHTGERPFKCSLCTKAFSECTNLHRHVRTHTGERPFKCLHCTKTFAHSSTLKDHQRVHIRKKTS